VSARLEFRVLGPLEASRDGQAVDLGAHRQRALLAALLVRADEVVSRERLVDELWGDVAPPSATNMVQVYVSRLRKALGRDLLVTRPPGYMLRLGDAQLDSITLADRLARAREAMAQARAGEVLDALSEALELWRGPPLADFTYESFAQAEAARLEELRLEAIELRMDAELALGRHARLVGELEQLIAQHPFRERLRGLLMLALYRSGRQAEALASYRAARKAMADELGIRPSRALRELEQAILAQDRELGAVAADAPLARPTAESVPINNLPVELTSLVGRERDVALVGELLAHHRLVTVVGPGGVGKTRVACRVASTISDRFQDGVCFVDMTVVADGSEVAGAVSAAVGIRDRPGTATLDTVVDVLRERTLLLVLDNCEHVLASAAQVAARVVTTCDRVRILATSRAPLAVTAEHVVRLEPLATTADGSEPAPAVALFIERTASHGVACAWPEPMLPGIREICTRLDGIPLAIELAAARTRAISPSELLAHLDDRLRLLAHPSAWSAHARQQTLEATIAWSYDLLSAEEQATLRRLSVFHGGFSFAAAAAVCADLGAELDTLERLTALVDCSVVSLERRHAGDRYRLLESIALFGAQRLRENDEHDDTRDRHARFYVDFATDTPDPPQGSKHQLACAPRLDSEQDNLVAAVGWCLDGAGEPSLGAELAADLGFHWTCRGRSNTAQHWMDRALERSDEIAAAPLAAVHLAYALHDYSTGDIDAATTHATEAAGIARACNDKELLAEALADMALGHQARGRDADALAAAVELRALQPRVRTPRARVVALLGTAQVAFATGHPDEAVADARRARDIARRVGDATHAAMSGFWLAYGLALGNGLQSARTAIREAGDDAARSGYQLLVADNLAGESSLALAAGDLETARRLLPRAVAMFCAQERWEDAGRRLHVAAAVESKIGFAERAALLMGAGLRWADRLDFQDELLLPEVSELRTTIDARLGTEALALAFHRGAAMALDEVVKYLLASEATSGARRASLRPSALT
jgi:predicted ATPase/DNA-binding SARP family transcriptional activator